MAISEKLASAIEEVINYEHSFPMFENFANKLRFSAPKESGLYLIGNTIFNPLTDEKFYLVKVGIGSNLKNRMSAYKTHNPLMFHIDFHVATGEWEDISEKECHMILLENCISRIERVDEWFIVSKEKYFEICDKGFNFFMENRLGADHIYNKVMTIVQEEKNLQKIAKKLLTNF